MLSVSDLKTDLQARFNEVAQENLSVPQKYVSSLHQTIKTLTRLLNIRIRTDLNDRGFLAEFKQTMGELFRISKQLSEQLQHSKEQLGHSVTLEKRLQFLETNVQGQIRELTQQNSELQEKVERLLQEKEESEEIRTKNQELELLLKQSKHERDQLKSQNSNLTSLVKQLKEERGSQIEKKLKVIKEEVSSITSEYQKKLEQRDSYIGKLERELAVVRSELEMSEDYKLLLMDSSTKKETK